MNETDCMYKLIGQKIREGRENLPKKLSQDKLATKLGVTRASIVNIEAGRQHAPLSLLWNIADALGLELIKLIPSRSDVLAMGEGVELDSAMLKQIKAEAGGDAKLEQSLTNIAGRLKKMIETSSEENKNG